MVGLGKDGYRAWRLGYHTWGAGYREWRSVTGVVDLVASTEGGLPCVEVRLPVW